MMLEIRLDRECDVHAATASRRRAHSIGSQHVADDLLPKPQQQCIHVADRERRTVDRFVIGRASEPGEQDDRYSKVEPWCFEQQDLVRARRRAQINVRFCDR